MFLIFGSVLVFSFITTSSAILSPLCDPSVENITIDSTELIDKTRIYFFTGDYITVVNAADGSIVNVAKIVDYFTNINTTFQTPVRMSFHETKDSKQFLTLITKTPNSNNFTKWRIDIPTNEVISEDMASFGQFTIKSTLDITNSEINASICYFLLKSPNMDQINLMEWDCPSSGIDMRPKTWVLTSDNQTNSIGFVDTTPTTLNQLNGNNITSAVIIGDKLRLYAGKYVTEVSTNFGTFIEFVVKPLFDDNQCKSIESEKTSGPEMTRVPTIDTTAKPVNSIGLIVIPIIVVAVIVTIVVIICWFVCRKNEKPVQKTVEKSKAEKADAKAKTGMKASEGLDPTVRSKNVSD